MTRLNGVVLPVKICQLTANSVRLCLIIFSYVGCETFAVAAVFFVPADPVA